MIDTTPPPQARADVIPDDSGGFVIMPHFGLPDFADIWFATGAPGKVDCADASGYRQFLLVPPRLAADELPATVCVKAFDMAGNPSRC